MKRLLAVGAFIIGTALITTEASAAVCYATSPTHWGYGYGSYRYARARALAECAVRTPRGYVCYIRWCRR